jgi:diguanylate cyclase (GGDEF)-like protein
MRTANLPVAERARDCCARALSGLLYRVPFRTRVSRAGHWLTRVASNLRVHDELTGLLNRRQFNLRAERKLSQGSHCALVFFDLDRLAYANIVLGYKAVDACIIETARMVRELANGDLVARYSGGNFVVLVSDTSRAQELVELVRSKVASAFCSERSRTLEAMHDLAGTPVLTVRVGAANAKNGETLAYLVQRADMALFEAKSSGRDCVRWAAV